MQRKTSSTRGKDSSCVHGNELRLIDKFPLVAHTWFITRDNNNSKRKQIYEKDYKKKKNFLKIKNLFKYRKHY